MRISKPPHAPLSRTLFISGHSYMHSKLPSLTYTPRRRLADPFHAFLERSASQPAPRQLMIRSFHRPSRISLKPPPSTGFVHLQGRALVAVTGHEAASFLQGLTTSNVPTTAPPDPSIEERQIPRAIYSAFLNAQGRLLQDAFIYPLMPTAPLLKLDGYDEQKTSNLSGNVGFLIEIDGSQAKLLVGALQRFKLRAKVSIKLVDSERAAVYFVWNDYMQPWTLPSSDLRQFQTILRGHGGIITRDDRAPNFGYRVLIPNESAAQVQNFSDILWPSLESPVSVSTKDYTLRRYLHSIPEGQIELPRGVSLVQESGIDFMRGVDFRKGCYVGQELTIRTQHTGVVRKRILPVMIYSAGSVPPNDLTCNAESDLSIPAISYGTDIKRVQESEDLGKQNRSVGKFIGNVGSIGLALVRLEIMVGLGPTGDQLRGWNGGEFSIEIGGEVSRDLRVKAFVPAWWDRERFLK